MSFTGKSSLVANELLRTAVAAYNAGMWAYYGLSKSNNPDARTTGRDYSADTLAARQDFRRPT